MYGDNTNHFEEYHGNALTALQQPIIHALCTNLHFPDSAKIHV